MKKVFILIAVIGLASSFSSATTTSTLKVWLELEEEYGPNMTVGDYHVQVWAQVIGGGSGMGISDLAVTIYTPDSNNVFLPVTTSPGGKTVETAWSSAITANSNGNGSGYLLISPTDKDYNKNGALDPDSDMDAIELAIGASNGGPKGLGLGGAVLLATETWHLFSTDLPLTLRMAVSARQWDGTVNGGVYGKDNFAAIETPDLIIPEPITMTMLGMGLSSLGLMVWRRRKETA